MQIITTHLNADFDCVASMVAARKLYPEAKMVFSGSVEKGVRDFLKRFPPACEFSRAKEIDLKKVRLLVVVDTQDPRRIGVFREVLDNPGVQVHVYDHHPEAEGKIQAHQATVLKRGASATVLFEALTRRGIDLSPEESTLLVLGIYQDTHSLSAGSATPEDFFAAGRLVKMGADLNVVADFVRTRLNPEQVGILNDLIRNMEVHNFAGIKVAVATATVDYFVDDLAVAVHKIRELENLPALFALIRMNHRVYLIARSQIEEVDAAQILRMFGGNGHPYAASASIREMTLIQIKEKLLGILGEQVQPLCLVKDIMHAPVVFAQRTASIKSVEEALTRFNLTSLPMVEDGKPVGLISRHIVEKAIHHNMGNEPAEEFMVREFSVTTPRSYFKTILPIAIEEKQKLIPVVDEFEGRLLGVVSRGDLLRAIYGDMLKSGEERGPLLEGGVPPLKHLRGMMTERVPKNIMRLLKVIAQTADDLEMSVYAVGGFVRDLLINVENSDLDVVVEGDGIQFAQALGSQLGGRVRSHSKFSTSVVVLEEGVKIDVATARMEYYKHPAALPTVERSSIKSDLFRRDFTINSLAVKLNGDDAFGLLDFFNGQRDLKDKALRVLHNLSFIEDPCRAFRAVRFEQRFQFTIGKETEAFLKNAVKKKLIGQLSGPRILNELILILKEQKPLNCIRRMMKLGLLPFIHPNLLRRPENLRVLERVEEVLAGSKIVPLERQPEHGFVYMLGLFHSLDDRSFQEAASRLQFPARVRDRLRDDLQGCKNALRILGSSDNATPKTVHDVFAGLSSEAVLFLLAMADGERMSKYALLYFTQYHGAAELALNGDDLARMGLSPGPIFQTVFETLREARLNGTVKTREDEAALVKSEFLDAKGKRKNIKPGA